MRAELRRSEAPGTARPGWRPEILISEAELVMSPPLEPRGVMQLHRWLHVTARARTRRLARSRSGDTVHVVTFEKPIPVGRMLAALPFVEKVIPEPLPLGEAGRSWSKRNGRNERSANRLRLILHPQAGG